MQDRTAIENTNLARSRASFKFLIRWPISSRVNGSTTNVRFLGGWVAFFRKSNRKLICNLYTWLTLPHPRVTYMHPRKKGHRTWKICPSKKKTEIAVKKPHSTIQVLEGWYIMKSSGPESFVGESKNTSVFQMEYVPTVFPADGTYIPCTAFLNKSPVLLPYIL